MSYYNNTFIYIFKIQKKTVHISINKHSHRAQTTCLGPIRRHCVPHVITMMAVPAINDSVEKKNVKKKIHTLFVSGPSVVLLLEPSLLSAMVVVAVHCHFVHVASNKKLFSKVKKK